MDFKEIQIASCVNSKLKLNTSILFSAFIHVVLNARNSIRNFLICLCTSMSDLHVHTCMDVATPISIRLLN